ncbi:MAG: glycosyltransferase [Planctomycetota bacterium]|nr:glycosyltransferase [Planctomycetota bacterium]
MRVTLVTETYFPQVNGVSRTLGQLVRVLRAAGDHVQLVHPDYGAPAESPDDQLVRSIRVPFYQELRLPLPPFRTALRAIDEFEPDILHIATEATLGLAALRHALSRKIPVVSSFHTNFDQYTNHYGVGWTRGALWQYFRWFHNQTRQTYVPSLATISELEAKGLKRLVLWPRGVDGTLFRPDRSGREDIRRSLGFTPEDVVIGHVSRIAVEKNVAYLGESLERVASLRPNARVLIVGDGPARPDLEAKLAGVARFVGYRTGDDLADHYAAADLFAFASLTETFGNVILEAMASGLPVVAVRSGGPGEIIQPGETGLLVAPDAPASVFADALIGLVDDATARARMSASARAYALSQTWEAIMRALRDRYEAIVGEAPTVLATR